jgi:two-component system, chemotaxis family, response regulator Rcp1
MAAEWNGCRVTRILLAEDNPADVYLLREALNREGVPVELTVLWDGQEAFDFIESRGPFSKSQLPDLVVLDLNLPKADGSSILKRIREKPEYAHIPVVVLTSSNSPNDRRTAARLGAASFLTKPADLDQFLALGSILLGFVPNPRTARAGGN